MILIWIISPKDKKKQSNKIFFTMISNLGDPGARFTKTVQTHTLQISS